MFCMLGRRTNNIDLLLHNFFLYLGAMHEIYERALQKKGWLLAEMDMTKDLHHQPLF